MITKSIDTCYHYKGYNRLLCATHWIDEYQIGHKIPHGLKVYYLYRKNMYDLFTKQDCIYYEKHTRVAKILGLSLDTIKKVYNPMLKQMGLCETKGTFKENNITYIIYSLDNLNGKLVNYNLKELKEDKRKYHDKDSFTYDNLKTLEHNKLVAKNIRTNSDVKYSSIPLDQLRELLKDQQTLRSLQQDNKEIG